MKDKIKVFVVFFMALIGSYGMQSQTYISDDVSQAQMLIEQQTDLNIENSSAVDAQNGILLGNSGNTIFLTQVGTNNQADLVISGAEANGVTAAFIQIGSDNEIDLELIGETFDMTVFQAGDDLSVRGSNVLNLSEDVKTQVNQQGNNQTLIIEGQNSISNSMQINMSGQGQEIIVRSFN